MAEFERYLDKVEKERDITVKGAFWSEFMDAVLELRRRASRNCEIHENVMIHQGEIKGYDKVLLLPDKLLSFVREKNQERAKNR